VGLRRGFLWRIMATRRGCGCRIPWSFTRWLAERKFVTILLIMICLLMPMSGCHSERYVWSIFDDAEIVLILFSPLAILIREASRCRPFISRERATIFALEHTRQWHLYLWRKPLDDCLFLWLIMKSWISRTPTRPYIS
jgi:hypothetical protein